MQDFRTAVIDYAQNSINFITAGPQTGSGRKVTADIAFKGGSFGTYLPHASLGWRINDKVSMRVNAGGTFSKGDFSYTGTDTPVAHPRHHCTRSLPHYQPRESVTSENIAPTHDVTPQTTWPRHRPLSPQCLQPAFLSYWQVGPDSFRFSSCSIRDFVTSHELDIYLMDSLSRSPGGPRTP